MFDRRRAQRPPGQGTQSRVHRCQTAQAAGNRDAQRSAHRYATGQEPFRRGSVGRGAGGVPAAGLARLRIMHLEETVATQAGHHRLHHAQGQRDCHRSVDCVAAGAQHVQARLCRQRMVGANRAVAAHDQRAIRTSGNGHHDAPGKRCRCAASLFRHQAGHGAGTRSLSAPRRDRPRVALDADSG